MELETLEPDCDVDDVVAAIERDGACIGGTSCRRRRWLASTSENGATTVVPGSHRWEFDASEADRQALPTECVQAEMRRGSVVLYMGSVVHGGGENRSGGPRIGMNITYSLAWLRQEENQYLSCPPDVARHLDPELADLLGYTMGNFALGFCTSPETGEPSSSIPEAVLGRRPRMSAPA